MTSHTPQLEYRRFSLPLREPLEAAHGTIESRDGFLVRVTTADGVTGLGEATPLEGWTESIETCERGLERAKEAVETADVGCARSDAMAAVSETSAARHGVSLAFLEASAKGDARPLYQELTSDERVARVPVNTTIGDGSPARAADAAKRAVDRGFDCCKLKAGVQEVEADIERVRRVREAVGPDVELRVDANGGWTYEQAETALEAFAESAVDVAILEQPLPAGALEGHAELRGRGVTIALDEGVLEHGIDAISDASAADAIVLKPMGLGGVDIARELAAWVQALDLVPIVTTTIDAVVARTAAVHLAAAIPDVPACGLATAEFLTSDLGRDPVRFENGRAVVPQAKGLGVSDVWDEEEPNHA